MLGRYAPHLPRLRLRSSTPAAVDSIFNGLHAIRQRVQPAAAVSNPVRPSPSNAGEQRYTFKVQPTDAGGLKGGKVRLDTYLSLMLAATAGESAASRGKVQDAIKAGLVSVNGRTVTKASVSVKVNDSVAATLLPAPPLEALPENIPLNVVYEDDHLMVVNKAAGMPVHISVGHHTGTLVNALLYRCGLPGVRIDHTQPSALQVLQQSEHASASAAASPSASSVSAGQSHPLGAAAEGGSLDVSSGGLVMLDTDEEDEDEVEEQGDISGNASSSHPSPAVSTNSTSSSGTCAGLSISISEGSCGGRNSNTGSATSAASINVATQGSKAQTDTSQQQQRQHPQQPGVLRPGIVHRLDMGTSGLLVVAKQEGAQRALSAQFKERTVSRIYLSLTVGSPAQSSGRVLTNIDRDTAERKRQAAYPYGGPRGRPAASNYSVLEVLAGGAAALVQWKLETGRTHQIRVHARHIGHPLIGDTTYGGGGQSAINAMARYAPGSGRQTQLQRVMSLLQRPALHARSLGFTHPVTGQRLEFDSQLPEDFEEALHLLRSL